MVGVSFRAVIAAAAVWLCLPGAVLAAPRVHLKGGDIEGQALSGGVERYLGLPYAGPPVGGLRWRAPQAPKPWSGLRPATAYARDCIQEPQAYPPGPGFNNPTSEDCLYLNVWRPAARPAKRLPVMVWIHGGAFIMGAGSFPSYDGANFARQGVILVTLNYRLGRFGVFAHPALSREQAGLPLANYGLMDQMAALKWVKANIAAFGGDPANVTVFGESAGASSVNFLMASPLARGLFAKAGSESGGDSAHLATLAQAEAAGQAWADKMGAHDLAALRGLPADRVWDGPVTTVAGPIIDGRVVTASTDQVFRAGKAAHVPYLLGFNSQEESLLRWLPGADEAWLARQGDKGQTLLALYMAEGLDRPHALSKLWGEAAMAAPSRARARSMGGPVWLYRYGYVPDAAQGRMTGAGHDAEMEMVFDNPDLRWKAPWSAADAAMARTVNSYWVNFARTGNPNGPGLPAWPAYTAAGDTLLSFGNDETKAVAGFGKARLDAIDAATGGR